MELLGPIPPMTVVPGSPESVSASALNAMRTAINRLILQGRGGDPQREVGIIKITDTPPTAAGLLTGKLMTPIPAATPGSWIESETVFVLWMNASDVPPEIPVNTFGFANNFIGHRVGPFTSGGTNRSLWVVNQSSLVVPIQLGNLTPTSGSHHDATIDPEGTGVGSTSTCWALCLNSGGAGLASFGPYIGLLSGKVTVSGSERPRVLFAAHGVTITGEESDGDPVSAFVQSLAFDTEDFHLTTGGSVVLSHAADEIAVSLEGVPVARAVELDFFNPSPGSSGGNVTFTPIDQGSGVVSVEATVSGADISGVVHTSGDESVGGTKTFTGGLVIPTGASHPGSPTNGQLWHKDGGSIYGYEDSETRRLVTVPDSAYAQGAVPYIDSTTKPAMLAPGTDGKVLTTHGSGADPTWETPSSGGITELTGDVAAGPGSGSQAATIASSAVTYAKIQDVPGNSVIGRSASTSGAVADIGCTVDGHVLTTSSGSLAFRAMLDSELPTHKDRHKSGGTDAFASTDLLEAVVKRLRESGSSTDLTMGAVADGEVLTRSGTDIVGGAAFNITALTAGDPSLADEIAIHETGANALRKTTVQEIGGFVNRQVAGGRLTLASGYPAYSPKRDLGAPSSTDTGAETVTFATAHGLVSGTRVAVSATGGGLTVATEYYVNAASTTAISFHTTVAAALAGTSKVNLTASITAEIYVIGIANRTLYYTPDESDLIALYDGTRWNLYEFTERSLNISAYTASTPYDIWLYDNAGTLTLDSTAWSSDTARATDLATQDGVDVKSGDATRRYLGTIRITATTGDCEFSWGHPLVETLHCSMYVWNRYNQIAVGGIISDLTSHNTNSTTYRQWRANTENRIDVVVGKSRDVFVGTLQAQLAQNASNPRIGFGYDSTTVLRLGTAASNVNSSGVAVQAGLIETPQIGKHTFYPLQSSSASSNATHANMFTWLHGHM